jgi:hypothetical protein
VNAAEARRVAAVVGTWKDEDRSWWRSLLREHPKEALVVAALILSCDATIVEPPE